MVSSLQSANYLFIAFILEVIQVGKQFATVDLYYRSFRLTQQFATANSLFIAFKLEVLHVGKQFATVNSLFTIIYKAMIVCLLRQCAY